jgi:hypothetical protein
MQRSNKRIAFLLAALALSGCASSDIEDHVPGVVRIVDDHGGNLGQYINRVALAKKVNLRVEILGDCLSACTLWTSIPSDKICVGKNAQLGFHDGSVPYTASSDTFIQSMRGTLMAYYPSQIKDWLGQHGGLSSEVKYLSQPELGTMFKACQ